MDEKVSENQEKRKFYRVEYPDSMRPTLRVRKHEFEVANISEKGVMFLTDGKARFGKWVNGDVIFSDGQTLAVEGKIVRKRENNIGIFLTIKPIPYSKILSEQRLLARFNPGDASRGE